MARKARSARRKGGSADNVDDLDGHEDEPHVGGHQEQSFEDTEDPPSGATAHAVHRSGLSSHPVGKQPKLNRRHEAHPVPLINGGEHTTAESAELFGVGRSTV